MRIRTKAAGLALALLAAAGCGGGTGTGGRPPDGGGVPSGTAKSTNTVVVRYDEDADGNPDLLTVDADARPFEIVEAMRGRVAGDAVDVTNELAGRRLDPAIDEALANHLAESFDIDVETDLEVHVGDETLTITVIE